MDYVFDEFVVVYFFVLGFVGGVDGMVGVVEEWEGEFVVFVECC